MNLIPWRNKQTDTAPAERELAPTIHRFRTEMDRMFDRFFTDPFGEMSGLMTGMGGWGPSFDLSETDKHVIIKAEVPGVDPKEVDISVVGNTLTIAGEKKEVIKQKGESYHRSERRFGSFRRSIQLPTYVDTEKVTAEHSNGVLTIQLDKAESATPKRVPVKAV